MPVSFVTQNSSLTISEEDNSPFSIYWVEIHRREIYTSEEFPEVFFFFSIAPLMAAFCVLVSSCVFFPTVFGVVVGFCPQAALNFRRKSRVYGEDITKYALNYRLKLNLVKFIS